MYQLPIFGIALFIFGSPDSACVAVEPDASLAGKWQAVKGTRDGKPMTQEELGRYKLTLGDKGGRTGWHDPFMGGDPFHNLAVVIDPKDAGKLYLIRQMGLKATSYPGIFKRDGKRLIICWNLDEWNSGPTLRTMPKDFAAPAGSKLTLLSFEKSKE